MDKFENSKQAGIFEISLGKDIYGELTFAGSNTSLYLRDNEHFDTNDLPGQCVKGTLHNLKKVTLLYCVPTSGTGIAGGTEESYRFATIFPHYVIYGDRHINHDEKTITGVHFVIDDASILFYDFDAFGSLTNAHPFLEQVLRAKPHKREIPIGPYPVVLYFTGNYEILAADTVLGRVSASHSPTHTLGGPDGVYLKNKIFTNIEFKEACTFNEAIVHTLALMMFLEMVIGRTQNLLKLNLRVKSDDEHPIILEVYWSNFPKRDQLNDQQRPHPSDVLVNGGMQPDTFARILSNWLDRHQIWRDARHRFYNSFRQQNQYSIDRLIGSANMFDILPDSAVPADVKLSKELQSAQENCRKIFKNLPLSPERDSILSALGRIGKSNLKNKIRCRGKLLFDTAEDQFPDLFTVTDEAVNCRNHYVHGSPPSFDYRDDSSGLDATILFTDTLEFVFAASDLIEAGWDIRGWSEKSSISHPFGRFRKSYRENLAKLRSLLE